MANSQEYIINPVGGGLGNKKVAILEMTIDTYATGGVALEVPTGDFQPIGVISENTTYFYRVVLDSGTYKLRAYTLGTTAEGSPLVYTTALTQASAEADIGIVKVVLVGA